MSGTRLGRGWKFPPSPPKPAGPLEWLTDADLVRQSILLILQTEPGERVMRPDFGCGLRRFLMEPNTPATRAVIAAEIEASLNRWEPRIDLGVVDVVTTDDDATVLVSVNYVHVRDRSAVSLTVPFILGDTGGA